MNKHLLHKEVIELNEDRYNQYKDELIYLKNKAIIDDQTKNFMRMNGNIRMAMNSLIRNLEKNNENDSETIELLVKFVDLLNPNLEGMERK